jgi:transposase
VTYAIAKGKTPSQLTDGDLLGFVAAAISRGRTNSTATCLPTRFRKVIKDNKLSREFPQVSPTVYQCRWSIKVADMPEPLRSEVRALLRWKLDRLVEDRPQKMRIRPASGKILEGAFTKLYGYAVKYYAKEHPDYPEITRLLDFANKQIIAAYLDWSINVKNLKGTSFAMFSMLIAALRQHPNYKGTDFSWYTALQASIPQEPSSDLEDRRAATSAPYDVLSAIPAKIAADRKRLKPGTVGYVELLHDELMVEWFLAFAWRQRNVRECRLGTELTGNLFCEVVNSTKNVAKPEWLEKKFNQDPTTKFWQIRFRAPTEVKGKRDIRGYVPSHLIRLLEEYLRYRSLLVGAVDPGTLFLNRAGGPMKDSQVTMLIGNLTVRYAGRRVTPHHFRDAFALAWLDDHPEDYITLSKALWHATVDITIEKYGRNYDESYGLRKAGDWIASRRTT